MRRFAPLCLLLLAVLAPSARAASTGPCVPGQAGSPTCHWWDAKVTLVADGDTVEARVEGKSEQVRFIGINAMELHTYSHSAAKRRGDCMGVEAADFADRLISASHNRIRLAAQYASSRSGRRIRRSVWVKSGGHWIDLARAEIAAGYDLFLPNGDEWAHNLEYQQLAARARIAGKNLWNPNACHGPDRGAQLSVVVKWDADGADNGNLNDEYIEIRNAGTKPVDIGGWWARDSWLNWWKGKQHGTPGYRFAPGTTVPGFGILRLHVGCGAATALELHWCQSTDAFENVTYDKRHMGDGAYLFDSKGDLRASFMYPCVVACVDPDAGKLRLKVHPSGRESIEILNLAYGPVDLGDHMLKLRNHGRVGDYVFGHVFPPGTVIPGGGVYNYVAPTANRFADGGGVVELRTLDDQVTDCAAWGFGRC